MPKLKSKKVWQPKSGIRSESMAQTLVVNFCHYLLLLGLKLPEALTFFSGLRD